MYIISRYLLNNLLNTQCAASSQQLQASPIILSLVLSFSLSFRHTRTHTLQPQPLDSCLAKDIDFIILGFISVIIQGYRVTHFLSSAWTVQRSKLCGETWKGLDCSAEKVVPVVIQEAQHYRLADWPSHLDKLFCGEAESETNMAALSLASTPCHSNTFLSRDGCGILVLLPSSERLVPIWITTWVTNLNCLHNGLFPQPLILLQLVSQRILQAWKDQTFHRPTYIDTTPPI